ncbi:MAG: helix-turn-helix transcriptional regulator [Muribaculaceae bacterium]|nr:helix-turn-helix transcriptional regulator [Muribaculaceae bacterium]
MGDSGTVKSRLIQFLKSQRITQTEFTRALGVSPTYIGAMRKGIPADRLKKIGELYPDLNRDWLLYGEGEMLRQASPKEETRPESEYETLLLPVEAFAGGLQMWSQGVRGEECRRIMSPISGVDFAIPIKGDSMEPRFHEGSTLLLKKINEKAFIPWGHTMVVDTENGVLVKNLYPAEDTDGEEYVVAKSLNPKYPPFKIPTSSIYGLYRVMGTVDIFSNL